MRFLVLGATGSTGGLVVHQAVAAGHEVVAFVRDATKLAGWGKGSVVAGDVRDADALATVMDGVDAVISALGLGSAKAADNLILDSTRAIVAAAERAELKRVVIMSAFGVGESLAKASWIVRLMYAGGKTTFADKAAGEKLLAESALDWTLAYPGLLTKGPATGAVRATDLNDLTRVPGVPRISRADVAAFLLNAATSGAWARRTAVLTVGA